jgi:transcriptional regulator with GAF, ATPase, and Fis domain
MKGRHSKEGEKRKRQRATSRVLVLDCDIARREQIATIITRDGARIADFASSPSGLQLAVVALDDGTTLHEGALVAVRKFHRLGVNVICYSDGALGWSLAMRCAPLLSGAEELLDSAQPGFLEEFERVFADALQELEALRQAEQVISAAMRAFGLIGEAPNMRALFRTVFRIGKLSDVPVLLTGETGTGKGLLAAALHRLDPKRSDGPFVALNCGAVSAGLAESELFGHRRGAFTGADRDRKGLFRAAEGGMIFLDEIGDLTPALQGKLLRVLEERRVLSVGEEAEVAVNVRIIAATNRDLVQMVSEDTFRADLFHRINILPIAVPPLRERPGDIPRLVSHFVEKYRALWGDPGLSASEEFVESLESLEMPGNVRQLEHIVCQALLRGVPGRPLRLRDLPPEVWQQLVGATDAEAIPAESTSPGRMTLELGDGRLNGFIGRCEKLLLVHALRETQGNQSQTARLLGITPRSVYNKVRKYQLNA